MKPNRFGWIDNPQAVENVLKTLPHPIFKNSVIVKDSNTTTLLYDYYQKVTNTVAPQGPQGIGDCVSWGWSNKINYVQVVTILDILHQEKELNNFLEKGWEANSTLQDLKKEYAFEEIASESVYGFSRVEVGQQHNSYEDGSVGAWAAKAATDYGHLTRKIVGSYNPNRAKEWGAKGVPDNYEPEAKIHTVKVASLVTTIEEAKHAITINKMPVTICSNQGFTTTRDNNGFCQPSGVWYHCMLVVGYREDMDGFCISQSWGPNEPNGPLALNQPTNTFWIASNVMSKILSQGDSFTVDSFNMYRNRSYLDWTH